MRIAIVQEHLDPRRGGAETSVLEMARCLARLGAEVTIVSAQPDDAGDHGDVRAPGEPAVVRLPVAGASKLARTTTFLAGADGHCRANGFAVIHAVTPCFSCNVYQPRGGTYVETVRRSTDLGYGPLDRLLRRIGKRFNYRQRLLLAVERQLLEARTPPRVACVSEYVRRQVLADFPRFPPDRLAVVFNGVDIAPLEPGQAARERAALRGRLGIGDQTPLALFVAHNFKLKGLAELIRAAAGEQGRAAGWVVAVAGRDRFQRYGRLARSLGVAERFRLLGPVADMRAAYAAADVLAHPTWYDPCSRVVLEALCCGLPTVTTRFNGAADAVEKFSAGVVVDSPADADALAGAVDASLRPGLRESLAAQRDAVRGHLSMLRHARELMALYRSVAGL